MLTKKQLSEIADIKNNKWIKVKRYEYVGGGAEKEYDNLLRHHNDETEFLIFKCRELASELLKDKNASIISRIRAVFMNK